MSEARLDGRIDDVVDLLTRLAAGDLAARGTPSEAFDDIDAIIVGVNMLGEELEASHNELEGRVQARTVELEEVNRDITELTELGNVLQACDNVDEAFSAMTASFGKLFPGLSGVLYLYRASRNLLEAKVSWGHFVDIPALIPANCWGLRRGQEHVFDGSNPGLSCLHVDGRTGNSICIPMSAHGEISGLLHLMDDAAQSTASAPRVALTPAKRSLALAVGEQAALALANLELRDKLRLQALRDPLTGLLNRRFVDEWINSEAARTDQSGRSFGVIMIDIDHFKRVNDVYGHDAGDQMLKAVGQTIKTSLRPGDLPCRYGGEEFVLIVADVDELVLLERAETVRKRIAELRVEHRGTWLPEVTMSAGVALYPDHGATVSLVIGAADMALYEAKRNGRNRILVAQPMQAFAGGAS